MLCGYVTQVMREEKAMGGMKVMRTAVMILVMSWVSMR